MNKTGTRLLWYTMGVLADRTLLWKRNWKVRTEFTNRQNSSLWLQIIDPRDLLFFLPRNELIPETRVCNSKRVLKWPLYCDWRPFGLRAGHSIMAESLSEPTFTSKTLKNVSTDQYACRSNSPDERSMRSKINASHYVQEFPFANWRQQNESRFWH